jgi:hypothetical protein
MSSISPRSDMMWNDPSARYSLITVTVPSACRYRSSLYDSVAALSASTAGSSRHTNRYGARGSLSSYISPSYTLSMIVVDAFGSRPVIHHDHGVSER